jgi:phosphatidylethanolamine-binding protein (PEBP) family uncharacterized protein
MSFELRSSAFEDYGLYPDELLAVSPPLEWTDPPEGTRSLALVVEQRPKLHTPWEEALGSDPETYWIAWGIPPHAGRLDAGAQLIREGASYTGEPGWALPAPSRERRRVLWFRLLALSEELSLARGASRRELLEAVSGNVVAEASLEAVWEPGRPRFFDRLRRLLA